jgi:hypothetical protein
MSRETIAMRTEQDLVQISSVPSAVQIAMRETIPYLVACLHAGRRVSHVFDTCCSFRVGGETELTQLQERCRFEDLGIPCT